MGLRLLTSAWRNIYAVDDDGLLRWYRYVGDGETNNVPGAANWHPNSGNPIGNGWGVFSSIHAWANGVVAGVHQDGSLYWFRYVGEGESDWTGTAGWETGSGTVIGGGWGGFAHIVPWAGTSDADLGLLAVTDTGDLVWHYFYRGWYPNSGNVIASGWGNFARLAGAYTTIFAIGDNGDLRWYDYRGMGEFDPSGTLGWQSNSGNLIGNGWNDFRHVCCSAIDPNGIHELFCAGSGGTLRWYRYTGQGIPDPAGETGWHANSRNIISGPW
jgi:hypothetical protein